MGTPVIRIEARAPGFPVMPTLALLLAMGGAAIALLRLDRLPVSVCFFKTVTGIPCLTCGTTRSLGRLAAFDPMGALQVNPLATVAYGVILVAGLLQLVLMLRGRTLRVAWPTPTPLVWVLLLALLVVNWLYMLWAGT